MQKKCPSLLLIVALALYFVFGTIPAAFASEYELHWLPPQNHEGGCNSGVGLNGVVGTMKRLSSSFDDATGLFVWEATFSPCAYEPGSSRLPNGFNLAVNDGQNPQSENAKGLAFIYFDASKLFDGSDPNGTPIVSVYKYNKMNLSQQQHLSPPIVSNHPDYVPSLPLHAPSDWLIEASVKDSQEPHSDGTGQETVRTFRLVLDANHVINGKPEDGHTLTDFRGDASWFGIGYGISAGLWFHPWYGATPGSNLQLYPEAVGYCTAATLGQQNCDQSRIGFGRYTNYLIGWYDTDYFPANKVPYCTVEVFGGQDLLSNESCYEVSVGSAFQSRVTGYDTANDALRADISDAPAGLVYSPNANSGQYYPSPLQVDLSWTPKKTDLGNPVNVKVKFTDQGQTTGFASYPENPKAGWCYPPEETFPAMTSCIIPICVVPVHAPCEITLEESENGSYVCEGTETTVDFSFFPADETQSGGDSRSTLSVACKTQSGTVVPSEIVGATSGTTTGQVKVDTADAVEAITCTVSLSVTDELCDSDCEKEFTIQPCPRDCEETPNGGAVYDECGVCGGDGSSCLDCAGVPNGPAMNDACGVCGGANLCMDCSGTPYGNKVYDACGVCGGDGSSCQNDCKATDIVPLLFQLDGNAAAQKAIVLKSLNMYLRNRSGSAALEYANQVTERTQQLYVESWTITWSLPQATLECSNPGANCVQSDFTTNVRDYNDNAAELYVLTQQTVKQIRKVAGKRKNGKLAGSKILNSAKRALRDSLTTSDQVPERTLVCSEKN